MATVQQLEEGIRRADAAGDTEGVRVLGQQLLAARKAPPVNENTWSQALSGFNEGVTGTLDTIASHLTPAPIMDDLMHGRLGNAAARAIGYATGLPPRGLDQGHAYQTLATKAGAIGAPSQSTGNQMVRRTAQSVGAAVIPAGLTGGVSSALKTLVPATTGGGGAAVAQQLFPGNKWAEIGGEIIGSLFGGGALYGSQKRSAAKAQAAAVPTIPELKQQASDLYTAAQNNGVTAAPQQTQDLANQISSIAQKEGIITPQGRVLQSFPKAQDAINLTSDYANAEMNPTQMQSVRKLLSDAAGNADPTEARIGMLMRNAFDDWTAPLSPELAQARGMARRYISADKLETARELATANSSQPSGPSLADAIRTQYRNLDRQIIKGQENGFTPGTVAAIQDVARGTPASNVAGYASKLAPTSLVRLGVAEGLPFAFGHLVGGPALGGLLAGGSTGIGLLGRLASNRMATNAADMAELVARNGGPLPSPTALSPELQRALTAAQAAQYLNSLQGQNTVIGGPPISRNQGAAQ